MEEFIRDNRGKGKPKGPRINDQIRISECRLVGDDGTQYGVVSLTQAKSISQEQGLDIVEVSPNANPPVVKLIDYGKFKYDAQKQANEAKQKQLVTQLKEIQFRPNIEEHDLDTKLARAEKFLKQGDKLKLVMQFRGREMAYRDAGFKKFQGIIGRIVEFGGIVESDPSRLGNRIICMISPDKKISKIAQTKAKELAHKKAEEKVARKASKFNKEQ